MSFITSNVPFFGPRQVPGLVLWLDASDSTTVSLSNNNVTRWNDKSGRNNNATSIGGGFPTYSSNSIVFTGTQAFATTLQSLIPNQSGFAVINYSGSTKMDIISVNRTSVGTAGIQQIILNGNSQILTTYGGTTIVSGSTTLVQNTRFLYNYTVNTTSSNAFMYVNGSQTGQSTGAYVFTGTGTVYIGNFGTSGTPGNEPFFGTMNEILLYSNVLTSAQRQQVEGHLAWKWGLQSNLPVSHPYRFNSQQAINPFITIQTPFINVIKTYHSDFSPRSIPGCALWLDAADATSIQFSSGANISNWRDKSGNGNNFTLTGATNPTYSTNIQNGLSVITFNGIANQTLNNSAFVFPNTAYTIFTVQYLASTIGEGSGYQRFIDGTPSSVFFVGTNGGNVAVFTGNSVGNWNDINALANPTISNVGVWRLVSFTVSGSVLTTFVNGSANTIKTGTTAAFTGLNIGSQRGGGQRWNGYGGEVIIYNTALAPNQRQQIEGYLASKWGILGSLASSNPFRGNIRKLIFPNIDISRPLVHSVARNNVRWTPTQISGCALWLDAADRASITLTGSNITNVNDKSGQNVVLSNATGFSYATNIFNGKYPSFYNPNGGFTPRTTARLGVNASFAITVPFTVFFVGHDITIASDYGYVIDSGPSGLNRPYILKSILETRFGTGHPTLYARSPFQGCAQFYNPTAIMHVNSSSVYTGSLGTFTTEGITIGNRFSLNEAWPGHLCEIIIYNRSITTRERQQIEGYLAYKWGIRSSLPANHPYKNIPVS
jgi:hypothetical protein